MLVVEFTFESIQYVVYLLKPGFLQRFAGINRATTTAANQNNGPFGRVASKAADFTDKMRIQFPVGAVLPGHVNCTDGMTDEKVLGIAAAIDKQRFGVAV